MVEKVLAQLRTDEPIWSRASLNGIQRLRDRRVRVRGPMFPPRSGLNSVRLLFKIEESAPEGLIDRNVDGLK